ncbi:thioesterase family protein [Aestuariibacter sp. AA17]|uniref:Thioesterase family protein n=1 Tax=Fluctibacter corallii TaxID=2984329 RepID=A0ABT3A966_9ALTE|nr:thioesterase family protein [Aestuariibacter sp. AA17]MCV2885213.1 thioesterase family protein [Aestuariibacter sp. AA17]
MHIDELLTQVRQHIESPEQMPTMLVPKDWSQGRTLYGGVSAALAYEAMRVSIHADRLLRSFNCNFVGPIEPDAPFEVKVEILREGKNASQILARIVQNGNVSLLAQASFGVPRKSKVTVANNDKHTMALPKKAKFIPQIPKLTPKFLRHFELAIDSGKLPFTGSKDHHIHGWMRYKKAPATITDAHLIGLIDAWPPTVLQMLKWPAPASTMSWNVEFIHPHAEFKADGWFAYQVDTRQAADGYGHTEANIWDENGDLIAISRQAVAIFD